MCVCLTCLFDCVSCLLVYRLTACFIAVQVSECVCGVVASLGLKTYFHELYAIESVTELKIVGVCVWRPVDDLGSLSVNRAHKTRL